MKTFVRLPLLAIALTLVPSLAAAQRTPRTDSAAVGVDVGVFRPDADALDPSLSLDGFYEYYVSPRTSLRLGLGWTSPGYDAEPDESLRHVRFGGDIIYNWEGGAIHPFVGAGLGVYMLQRRENGEDIGDSDAKLGGVLLGGVEYFTSNSVSVKGEASYHLISNAEGFGGRGPRNPDGFKLSVGLKMYF
jgi:hypothetical protein